MNEKPLVSVVLPVYNGESFLRTCLDSILSQTYKNIEIIAIDDASKDHSYKILKEYKKIDARIKVSKNKKRYGFATCFNRSVRKAKGELITFMSVQAIPYKNRLKKQVDYLLSHPKTAAVGTQVVFLKDVNKRVGKSAFPLDSELIYKTLLPGLSMQFESVLINRTILPKDLLYFKTNSYPFIFSDVFIKLLQYGKISNMLEYLQYHHTETRHYHQQLTKVQQMALHARLWLKSMTEYDLRPSFRSLLSTPDLR